MEQMSIEQSMMTAIPTDYSDLMSLSPTAEIQSAFIKHYQKFNGKTSTPPPIPKCGSFYFRRR